MNTDVEITDRNVDGCVVLDIKAENFTYPQTVVLKSHVSRLIDVGNHYFVLNATAIKLIDSYGLATIISVFKMIKEAEGALALYGLNEMFTHLVKVTHLNNVLEIWSSEAQATYYLSTIAKTTPRA